MGEVRGLDCLRPTHRAQARILIIPHAGSGPAPFWGWPRWIPRFLEPWVITLPGRQRRIGESPLDSIPAMVGETLRLIREVPADLPWIVFGHSMGALVGWEVSRRMAPQPELLIASGCQAPGDPTVAAGMANLTDDALVARVRSQFGGFPPEIDEAPEVLELVLPVLRADLTAVERYRPEPGVELGCPVLVVRGEDDPAVSAKTAEGWRSRTTGDVTIRSFTGGHHYLLDRPEEVLSLVRTVVRDLLRSPRRPASPETTVS